MTMTRLLLQSVAVTSLVLIALPLRPAVGQNWHLIDVQGEVLLPDGSPWDGVTVYVRPNDVKSSIKPGGTKTWSFTDKFGRYMLNIQATGPIILQVGAAFGYENLSHRSGALKINCFMPSSTSQQKQNLISTVMDAYEWGERWNEFLPPEQTKGQRDVIRFESGQLIVPKQYTRLFEPERKGDRKERFGLLPTGQLFIKPPRGPDDRPQRIGVDLQFQDLGDGKIERTPVLRFQ